MRDTSRVDPRCPFDLADARAEVGRVSAQQCRHPAAAVDAGHCHSTVAFTMDVYTSVAEELAESAAAAVAAYIPRKTRTETAE